MKHTMNKTLLGAALLAGTLLSASPALADGLMARAEDIPAKERAELLQAIAEDKAQHPAIYDQVRNVSGYKPETYRKFRNPIPLVGRELRRFGKPALLPMLEALAVDVWARGDAKDNEWRALKVGMLEAVAHLRDTRAAEVVKISFAHAQHADVQRASAEAVGTLCAQDASMITTLGTALKGSKRLAAIDGLGQCRTTEAAQLLVAELHKTKDATEADRIAHALGRLGSSWAWRAIANKDKARGKEGLEIRRIASEALVDNFARFAGKARAAHQVGLTMVQYPGLRGIAEQRRAQIDPSVYAQLEKVVARVEKRNSR